MSIRPGSLRFFAAALALCSASPAFSATESRTEQLFLSGHDTKDAVPWEFTVTEGRKSGKWTTIPVPSNWEQFGFGGYNYGQQPGPKAREHGLYRLRFKIPSTWTNRRIEIVFDAAMTDTSVKINGKSAGPVHQGGFYRFRYDITPLVKIGGENLLEADVAKVSSNALTEVAERGGDYWDFGGIFRPVFLEATPAQAIAHMAIDARADGALSVDVSLAGLRDADRIEGQVLDERGQPFGPPFSARVAGGANDLSVKALIPSPKLWSAETPNLYTLRLSLYKGPANLHTVTERFGFRTFEARAGQGLFLNGQRILLKGIGRHSFRPESGRALSREQNYDDVRLIKAMNMNAVRMTHYPPDKSFLDACDELGLYVLDELSGWQHAHDTEVGKRLVRELVTRDVNHPSILFWDNGNEGGWNVALDGEFALYDPQKRLVLHPFETFSGIDTKHYPGYDDLKKRLAGPNIVMPTEMLHGLFDGGGGAGLDDYWRIISGSPYGGGGFLWVFADEGIARTDQNGRIDVFSTFGPDGVVGPHHEKEASFFTIRDVYSPVQIDAPRLDAGFDGRLTIHNGYDFTSLDQCSLKWRLLDFPGPADKDPRSKILAQGSAPAPKTAPHTSGSTKLALPASWREAGALSVTAFGPNRQELWTWTWPIPKAAAHPAGKPGLVIPGVAALGGEIRLRAGSVIASFDAATGLLRSLQSGSRVSALTAGPRLAFARPAAKDDVKWLEARRSDASGALVLKLDPPQIANHVEMALKYPPTAAWGGFRLEVSPDGKDWKTLYDGTRRMGDGNRYEFPPQMVGEVRVSNFRQTDGGEAKPETFRIGCEAARFPAIPATPAKVTSGTKRDAATGETVAWLESAGGAGLDRFRWTLAPDGELRLSYSYTLSGPFCYHGITFDLPEKFMTKLRWLGDGPCRVWKNRTRGTTLDVHETVRKDFQPGETWTYPEFDGYFAGVQWALLDTTAGPLTMDGLSTGTYLRIGTPRISHPNTTVQFPAGDLSFLQAIPGIGTKFSDTTASGPAGKWSKAEGVYSGTVTFRLEN